MTGANCNSREFFATIPKAADGSCELITTAGGFKKRGGDGCFPAEVRITMADGSRRPVASLVEGQQVFNPISGRPTTVKKLIAGEEMDPIYEIWAGQRRLLVTSGHPVRTTSGDRRADGLIKGDMILLGDGDHALIEEINLITDRKGGMVYNVELTDGTNKDDQHYLVADGMVTGDHVIQRRLTTTQISQSH